MLDIEEVYVKFCWVLLGVFWSYYLYKIKTQSEKDGKKGQRAAKGIRVYNKMTWHAAKWKRKVMKKARRFAKSIKDAERMTLQVAVKKAYWITEQCSTQRQLCWQKACRTTRWYMHQKSGWYIRKLSTMSSLLTLLMITDCGPLLTAGKFASLHTYTQQD